MKAYNESFLDEDAEGLRLDPVVVKTIFMSIMNAVSKQNVGLVCITLLLCYFNMNLNEPVCV